MLEVFDPERHALVSASQVPRSGWLHATAPTAEELTQLEQAGVPREFLRHALDVDEVARLDHDERGARLAILRVPRFQGAAHDLPYRATTLAVVLLDGLVVTLAMEPVDVVTCALESKSLSPDPPLRLLLRLLMVTADRFLVHLRAIEQVVGALEDQLEASLRNREVLHLLKYQKALTHFTTALASNQIMLERLKTNARFQISPEDRELLEDVEVEVRQAIEMSTVAADILSQMMDAFASIISNNLNVVMKVLTSLTIVLTFPMLVATFYGMNVQLPGAGHPYAFFGLLVASASLAALVVVLFWRKRWL